VLICQRASYEYEQLLRAARLTVHLHSQSCRTKIECPRPGNCTDPHAAQPLTQQCQQPFNWVLGLRAYG